MKCPYCKTELPYSSQEVTVCEVCNASFTPQKFEDYKRSQQRNKKLFHKKLLAVLAIITVFVASFILQFVLIREVEGSNGAEYFALLAIIPLVIGLVCCFTSEENMGMLSDRLTGLGCLLNLLLLCCGMFIISFGEPSVAQLRRRGIAALIFAYFILLLPLTLMNII